MNERPSRITSIADIFSGKFMKPLLFFLILATVNLHGQGRIAWNESVNGPLGNTTGTATSLGVFLLGTNSVIGATEVEPTGPSWFVHEDYFLFSLPSSARLDAIYITIDKQHVLSWFGTPDYNTTIGYTLNSSTGDLLPQFGLAPIGSGSYGMYMANNDLESFTSVANYKLDFVVTAVPEPGTWALLVMGGVTLWGALQWRKK